MYELDGRRSLTNGGGAALDRAGSHIPRREDPGDTGLKQVHGAGLGAGEDEAVVVAGDHLTQPVGAGHRAEEEKQRRKREPLTIVQRHRLELTVGTVQLGHLAAVTHRDAIGPEPSSGPR